jgi:hypothetical protein
MKPEPSIIVLHLRPEPGNWRTPPLLRLRAALKCLLLAFGLRCTACRAEVTEVRPSGVTAPDWQAREEQTAADDQRRNPRPYPATDRERLEIEFTP